MSWTKGPRSESNRFWRIPDGVSPISGPTRTVGIEEGVAYTKRELPPDQKESLMKGNQRHHKDCHAIFHNAQRQAQKKAEKDKRCKKNANAWHTVSMVQNVGWPGSKAVGNKPSI